MTAKNSHYVFMVSKASQQYLTSRTAALGTIVFHFNINQSRALKQVLQAPLSFCLHIYSDVVSRPPSVARLLSDAFLATRFDQNGNFCNKDRQTKQKKLFFLKKSSNFQRIVLDKKALSQR